MGGGQERSELHVHWDHIPVFRDIAGKLAGLWRFVLHHPRHVVYTNGNVIWMPGTNVVESEDALIVTMELPGVHEQDIAVVASRGNLVIQGGRAVEELAEDERRTWSKDNVGRFYRRIALPPGATTHRLTTTFEDGELRVRIPMQPLQHARRR